jgi:parallel beta-helix repeat protein
MTKILRKLARSISCIMIMFTVACCASNGAIIIDDHDDETNFSAKPIQSWYNNAQAPIAIDPIFGNGWNWARTQAWCRLGTGFQHDPYIIENISIYCPTSQSYGISISNSWNYYFIIRNCTIIHARAIVDTAISLVNTRNGNVSRNVIDQSYGGFGIRLEDSSDNVVSRNNIFRGVYSISVESNSYKNVISGNNVCGDLSGIRCLNSMNNTISDNDAEGSDTGIYLQNAANNTVVGNNATCYSTAGIYLNNATDNSVTKNNATGRLSTGIRVTGSSYNNIISENNATGMQSGIHLQDAGINNMITRNVAYGDAVAGISLNNTSNTTITCNNATSHLFGIAYAIKMGAGCAYNKIVANNFNANLPAADGTNTLNAWDNGTIGNWYGDYERQNPSASHDDVIWNTPYVILSSTAVEDRYPLFRPYDVIDRIPVASFMANDTVLVGSGWVQFTFTGSEGNVPLLYQWNFSDGMANSTARSQARHFPSPGNYTVTLTVTDKDGDQAVNSIMIEVQADISPLVAFTASQATIIGSKLIQFNFTGSAGNGPPAFQWDFGDGKVNSTTRDPSHPFTYPGHFTVTLCVVDADGDFATSSMEIDVLPDILPATTFTANQTTIVEGSWIQFNSTGDGGNMPVQLQWNFGDSTGNATSRDP